MRRGHRIPGSSRACQRPARGFTVLEIMIALLVMSIGFVAVYSLQVIAIAGNADASDISRATNLAERWMETLRRESLSWTTTSGVPARFATQGRWLAARPSPVNGDNLAADDREDVTDARYCVWYRVEGVPAGTLDPAVLRLDVRVAWPRRAGDWTRFEGCPTEAFSPIRARYFWEVTVASTVFRHGA